MLLFIRHARTAWNAGGSGGERHRSWIDDIPLAPDAQQEIDTVTRLVSSLPVQLIFSAPAYRAKVVAQSLVNALQIPAILTTALNSWYLGEYMGMSVAETAHEIAHYMLEAPDTPVPGGESFNAFKTRYLTFLQPLWSRPELIVLVTHGRNAMIAQAWGAAGAKPTLRLDPADLTVKADLLHPGEAGVVGQGVPWTDLGLTTPQHPVVT